MAEMVSKITVQKKIAELERRIEALEKGTRIHSRITETYVGVGVSGTWMHLQKMWDEFNEVMKESFGGKH